MDDELIDEQKAYYEARAPEYDEWFLRQGRYDRGDAHHEAWRRELGEVERVLAAAAPYGHVLELACGTGLWTRHLVADASSVTVVDASAAMLGMCRQRIEALAAEHGATDTEDDTRAAPGDGGTAGAARGQAMVCMVEADIFSWQPDRRYDLVFFGFWLSHVPDEHFARFWSLVSDALRPGGRAFFVDSQLTQASTAVDHPPLDASGVAVRMLNDGRSFRVIKRFHEPATLEARLAGLGWRAAVVRTERFVIYGVAEAMTGGRRMGVPVRQ